MGEGPSTIPQSQGELKIIKGEVARQDTNDTHPVLTCEETIKTTKRKQKENFSN